MTGSGIVRRSSLHDFKRIIELEYLCFPGDLAYSKRQLRYLLTKANSTVLVETNNKVIRGFIIVLYRKGTKVAGIETINVDPQYRKKGVALRLLNAAEAGMRKKGIKKIRLEVSTTNHAAIILYGNAGFQKKSILKNYYSYDHEGSCDALRMIKELS
jgi:ribosomal protein S18 acetylase RimI-like enzyme